VLSLRELQGLTYSGIAQVMGLSESAIETLLHRARKRFKAEYLYMGFVDGVDGEKCTGLEELLARIDEVRKRDLNAIRLQRS